MSTFLFDVRVCGHWGFLLFGQHEQNETTTIKVSKVAFY